MNKIGKGFYYDVYDLGNGRVLKKDTSYISKLLKLQDWYGTTRLKRIKVWLMFPKWLLDARRSLEASREICKLDPELFGNPAFGAGYEYEQDIAVTLENYFKSHSYSENAAAFDRYVGMLHRLWAFGVSDTVFNFTLNAGMSLKTGKLVCFDFNEFTNSKELIAECIRREKWRTQASLRYMPEGDLKSYILEKMSKDVTMARLDEHWASADGPRLPHNGFISP